MSRVSLRQRIEDTLIGYIGDALLTVKNPRFGYLKGIEPYNGEIDQTDGPEDIRRVLRGRSPMIFVLATSANFTSEGVTRRRYNRLVNVEFYIASNHLRTREDRNRADVVSSSDANADPGIYLILDDIHELISGQCFKTALPGVGAFTPEREDILLQFDDFTAWRAQYSTRVDAHVKPHSFGDVACTDYQIDGNLDGDAISTPPNPLIEADGDFN